MSHDHNKQSGAGKEYQPWFINARSKRRKARKAVKQQKRKNR